MWARTEINYFSCSESQLSLTWGPRPNISYNNYEAPVTYKPTQSTPNAVVQALLQDGEPTPVSGLQPPDSSTPLAIPGALSDWVREQLTLTLALTLTDPRRSLRLGERAAARLTARPLAYPQP